MMVDIGQLSGCEACCKAWFAATAMLGVSLHTFMSSENRMLIYYTLVQMLQGP